MKNVVYRLFGLVLLLLPYSFIQADDYIWQKVELSELTTSDIFVIVDVTSSSALPYNGKAEAPPIIGISLNADASQITSIVPDDIKWKLGISGAKFYFCPINASGSRLYFNASNNGVRIGPNYGDYGNFEYYASNDYIGLFNSTRNRYLGVYNKQDWRCYDNVNGSIAKTQIAYYRYTENIQKVDATITFLNNGVEETKGSYIGASFSLPSEASVIEGLEFVGWSKEPIVAGAAVANDAILSPGTLVVVEEDMTFYAVYAKPVESGESAYIKVETEQEDWSGTYLIVCESSGKAFNSSLGKSALFPTDGLNVVDIAINDSKIAHNEVNEQYEFVVAKYNEGYSIKSKSGYYIGNKISSGDFIGVASTTEMSFKFEYKNEHSPLRMNGAYLCYDNSSGFSYSNSQHTPIQLYKRSETTKSYAFYTTSLSTEVAINKYGYSTWYAGMPVAVPEGMKAYYCIVDGNTAVLNDMGTVIPANTGAVLYAEEAIIGTGGSYAMSYTNESITTDITKNLLIGYVQDTEVNNGKAHYALNVKDNVVGFYVPKTTEEGTTPSATSTFTAKAGKAYLELETTASAVSLVIRRNSDTSIDAATVIPEDIIYDLTGRRVITPSKGIYIVNGRKVTM